MATVYITHHKYPENPQAFVIDVTQIVKLQGEPGTSFYMGGQGEEFWQVVVYTSGLDSSGNFLGPYWITDIDSNVLLDDIIKNKISDICEEIDWSRSTLTTELFSDRDDRYSPVVTWSYPIDGQVDVPIDSRISVRIKEPLPGSGIDISTLVFKVNGMVVVPDIYGHKYDYTVSYRPIVSK